MADAKEKLPAEKPGVSKPVKEPIFTQPNCIYVYCPHPDLCRVACQNPKTL